MNQKTIFKFCKDLGCCDRCCLRYLGVKIPNAYENSNEYVARFQDEPTSNIKSQEDIQSNENTTSGKDNVIVTDAVTKSDNTCSASVHTDNDSDKDIEGIQDNATGDVDSDNIHNDNMEYKNGILPPTKRRKLHHCVSCLGILQEDTWPDTNLMLKEMLHKKSYECPTFACALSAPIATLLRERAVTLLVREAYPEYDPNTLTPLKEAWKWSYGAQAAAHVGRSLHSGAVSPLLVTVNMEYPHEMQELEILKALSPSLFESRSQQRKRFAVEFTRRAAEQALAGAAAAALRAAGWPAPPEPAAHARCAAVHAAHAPLHLAGRLTPEECEHRLKFMSAGREDVDVRCLGDGRPFAVEVTDPRRELTEAELKRVCEDISAGGKVVVREMMYVTREELAELKKGEETKCKTYEALCIKLSHSEHEHDKSPTEPVTVTEQDIANINSYSNTSEPGVRVQLVQRTPIRVLHRRPLLARTRHILQLSAAAVPGQPALLALRVRTSAGTYVKEWVHGELARTAPALQAALRARVDILALDVARVHLDWPRRAHPAPR
ncbi:putative tRNA pseudouridine synthase Pus10 isoform X2 [Galleria mellonella]|uniref:tRNA pseudouridine(55) synthase n=1 Tax=Galleria mellonella TaxID=7137 RepID=A0ABM3MBE3_GALME|nr:putative tRNA pseudouridine synthase Pus10 isoform X2 [Galleria mellonella]